MYSTLLHKPRNSGRFSTLMDLYEQNYMLMRLLAPDLKHMGSGSFLSTAAGTLTLELRDLEHSRYTSTFRLTYRFSEDSARGRSEREPDLAIRLYHDARSCEVMSGLMPDGRVDEERRTRDLEEGRRLNRFLNRWLSYCLRQGHQFGGCHEEAAKAPDYCAQY